MIRTRLTWVIAGAVVALLVVAGDDALRSSGNETAGSPTTASTTARKEAIDTSPPCTPEDLAVSIEVRKPDWNRSDYPEFRRWLTPEWRRGRVATIVVRNVAGRSCFLAVGEFRFVIRDRAFRRVAFWTNPVWFAAEYSPGYEKTFFLPTVFSCDRPGPYSALATVGPFGARRGNLSRSEITCGLAGRG
jgi:hypothetical protein